MFIAWGPELGFLYNDSYAEILGAKHPGVLGRPFPEVWREIWADIGPLVDRTLAGERIWQDELHLVLERHGYPEDTWFSFSYSPARDETGAVAGVFCACAETTRRVLAERALLASQQALEEERDRLYALFEDAPSFVAVVESPQHVFRLTNAAYRQLIGHRDVIGKDARAALPEVEGQGLFELLDQVYATGDAFRGDGVRVFLQRTPDAPLEERFVDFIYQPIREADGTVSGIFVEGSDTTERSLYLAQQKLLLDELNHRVKNNLATVQSIAYQTARHAPDLETFRKTFESRLIALSRTHDVLTASAWESADLKVLLQAELDLYGESRFRLRGPSILLSSAQALALGLVIHELATNAAKYGAFSGEGGCVRVTWSAPAPDDRAELHLTWEESDGPSVGAPERSGFGSRLIERGVRELGGEVEREWRPHGLLCRITVPLTDE
jgi:two-component sensor histidine kinase